MSKRKKQFKYREFQKGLFTGAAITSVGIFTINAVVRKKYPMTLEIIQIIRDELKKNSHESD